MRARYTMMIEGLPKESWHDRRLTDYAKSSDRELGTVIECHEWVEGTDIGYWILDVGVGTGSKSFQTYTFPSDPILLTFVSSVHNTLLQSFIIKCI